MASVMGNGHKFGKVAVGLDDLRNTFPFVDARGFLSSRFPARVNLHALRIMSCFWLSSFID